MSQLRLASIALSLCLHAGVVALAWHWPVADRPLVDTSAPVIDINIFTIGRPGAATAPKPAERQTPSAPKPQAAAPREAPQTPAPTPEPVKPQPAPVKPEARPIPIAQPEKTVEPPRPPEPEKPKEPEKPVEKPAEKPAEQPKETAKPAESPKPQQPRRPRQNPDDVLKKALSDLSGDPLESALRDLGGGSGDGDDASGDGPGGQGGDGIGLVGSYMQSLVSRIKPNWEYAGRADRRNPTAVVAISIARDGAIIDAVIVTSSGDAAFDGSVIKAVRDTIRVEPPPSADLANVQIPFAYEALK